MELSRESARLNRGVACIATLTTLELENSRDPSTSKNGNPIVSDNDQRPIRVIPTKR